MNEIKPDLVGDISLQRVMGDIDAQNEDYWGPVKDASKGFYDRVIKGNWMFVVLIFIIVLLIAWRYRYVKHKKEDKKIDTVLENYIKMYNKKKDMLGEPRIP